MAKMHVVMDIEIGKVLRAFDAREDAVEYVWRLVTTNGEGYVHDLALSRQDDEGRFGETVTGDDLLALVRDVAASRTHALTPARG